MHYAEFRLSASGKAHFELGTNVGCDKFAVANAGTPSHHGVPALRWSHPTVNHILKPGRWLFNGVQELVGSHQQPRTIDGKTAIKQRSIIQII
jgi:hypothetical protein